MEGLGILPSNDCLWLFPHNKEQKKNQPQTLEFTSIQQATNIPCMKRNIFSFHSADPYWANRFTSEHEQENKNTRKTPK